MGDQPEDAPAVENPPPPVNPPIQPIQPVNSLPLLSKLEGIKQTFGPNGFDILSAIGSLLFFKTNQTRNKWEHFSMQWGIVRMTSLKR